MSGKTMTPSGLLRAAWTRGRPRGPGMLVTAAFIGPGTITTCSLAGARFGHDLLWALLLSVLAGIVLQEMSARLGVVGRVDLSQALRQVAEGGGVRLAVIPMVVLAVALGCAAYEAGNLIGAGLGLETVLGGDRRLWGGLSGVLAWGVLRSGGYALVGRILAGLVALMGLCFLATAAALAPEVGGLLRGLLVPEMEWGSVPLVLALVGTTVVPYNLFLHSAAARDRWDGARELPEARWDLGLSMAIGGCISGAVIVTAAEAWKGPAGGLPQAAGDLARQIDPLLGSWAGVLFGIGLFAAGLTSAMTAPLAAAAATTGILALPGSPGSRAFRSVWMSVLGVGFLLALLDLRPLPAILVAQAANGLLLPVAAVFLLVVMNRTGTLAGNRNGLLANLLGISVVALACLLGLSGLLRAIGFGG